MGTPTIAELHALLAEYASRQKRTTFDPAKLCFGQQRAFVEDTRRFAVACTTRRAGKTVGARSKLVRAALGQSDVIALYVTLTRRTAEELIWQPLVKLNEERGLGGKANHTKLIMRFPNWSAIICAGCKDRREAEKLRGLSRVALAIVDEAQSFPASVIEYLVHDVLEPLLVDVRGALVLTGTPGPVPTGYFHAAAHNQRFAQHRWSLRENPHLGKDVEEFLRGIRERRGIDESHPTYRREYLGEWVADHDALMLHYLAERNTCAWAPGPEVGWTYVLGFDLGYDDADALAVLGWARHERRARLVDEVVVPKQGITELAVLLQERIARWNPQRVVGDFGGLGKKIAYELQKRHGIPCEPADKVRKAEHIELLDDGLRTGNFLAPADSRFAQDCMLLQWDADAKAKGILREAPEYHSDVVDAALYAYRTCLAYLEAPAPKPSADPGEDYWEREQTRIERPRPWDEELAEEMGYR